MQFYCLPSQSLTASDVHLIASSVEHHPSLRELIVRGRSESVFKGAVEGMARRHGVDKLAVALDNEDGEYPHFIVILLYPWHTDSLF